MKPRTADAWATALRYINPKLGEMPATVEPRSLDQTLPYIGELMKYGQITSSSVISGSP